MNDAPSGTKISHKEYSTRKSPKTYAHLAMGAGKKPQKNKNIRIFL